MQTVFDDTTDAYIKKCKATFDIPIAVGFGITRREDIAYLEDRADIAICCTAAVKIHLEHGPKALEAFLLELR